VVPANVVPANVVPAAGRPSRRPPAGVNYRHPPRTGAHLTCARMPKSFLPTLDTLTVRNRGNTPHWEMPQATYSITYRLYDAVLPAAARRFHEARDAQYRSAATAAERLEIRRTWEHDFDALLDRGDGACHLQQPRIATVVADNLRHWAARGRYYLHAWCVMPNHVHAVIQIREPIGLATVVHSWKSYTAKRANEILGRTGTFWQREYYDRIIRNDEHLSDAVAYVLANPAKAGLREWPFLGGAGGPPA
jgi:REP element-mobilizing transposase RayT